MTSGMAFTVGSAWLTSVFLLSIRLATVFAMTPLLTAIPMPTRVRVLLVFGLSIVLAMGLPTASSGVLPTSMGSLVQAALAEFALGATLALGILIAFGAFSVAGRLLDVQIGFGMAQVYDPVSRRQLPILTSLFNQMSVLVFFLINGHHTLLRGIVYSLERFPLGAPWSLEVAVAPILKQVGGLFSLGFALAAPVAFCLLMVELALGVIARNLPQMNVFTVGFPVKIVVGLVALSLWFAGIGGIMTKVYASIYQTWEQFFSLAGGMEPTLTGGR